MIDSKAKQKRAPNEWIKTSIPAIIDAGSYELVRLKRTSRAPSKVAPRIVTSPTLLAGLIKCGVCGNSMTLATGKSGRYKYYKCTSRKKRNHACSISNLPMEKTDQQVLTQLAEKVFAPIRVQSMMVELLKRLQQKILS